MELRQNTAGELLDIPELILNNLPIGIIFCDRDCRIQYINRIYAEYLGVDPEKVLGKPITDFIPGSRLNTVLRTGNPELRDRCHIGEGDKSRVIIVNRIPVKGPDGSVVGVISQSLFGDLGELKELTERVDHLEEKVTTYREKIRSALSAKFSISDIIGRSGGIGQARDLLRRYAMTDSPVLITGATGTGKELCAHALHAESQRAAGPFVSINCAAIPYDLLESELFGYAPGAFTGAQRDGKMGMIELADKGTLFLDEIGDMPLSAQVKLLRVLEDKMVYRLGCPRPKKVDFRLAAATNRDLMGLIREGKFREELYYRLSVMTVRIPLLQDRREDIPLLVRHILDRSGRKKVSSTERAMDVLLWYGWPGNVRELKNVLERAMSLCRGDVIDLDDLPQEIVIGAAASPSCSRNASDNASLSLLRARNEQQLIMKALEENRGNMRKTATMLGISRATLYEKVRRHRISRPPKTRAG